MDFKKTIWVFFSVLVVANAAAVDQPEVEQTVGGESSGNGVKFPVAEDDQAKNDDDTLLFWLWTSISIGYFSLILLAVVGWIVTYTKKRKKDAAKKKALAQKKAVMKKTPVVQNVGLFEFEVGEV
eukprot:326560_1